MNKIPSPSILSPVGAKKPGELGQATVEYAIMMAMFLGVAVILVVLMSVFSEYGWRMISLVSLDL